MEVKGSNQSLVKVTNQHLIVAEVRDKKKLSRSDLAKILQLSNPSVSKHVDNLIAKGLLIEVGSLVTDVGRRPIMLEFNSKLGCVAAIDMSSNDARICISDLAGNKLAYSRVDGGQIISAEVLERIIETMRDMLGDSDSPRFGRLLGICIGAPGVIEPVTGHIHWSGRIEDYSTLDLREMFSSEFGVPVTVKNDINLAVVGERTYGSGVNIPNMLMLSMDAGIGMGLILDGKLYEGVRGVACDIGVLLPSSEEVLSVVPESFDDYIPYMLEEVMNVFCLINKVREDFDDGRDTVLREWISNSAEITFDDVVKAYGMGDPMVGLVIKRYAKMAAVLIKNMASMFDVELILIGGMIAKLGTSFLNETLDAFYRLPGYSAADIKLSTLYDTAVIYGCIETAVQAAVDVIINSKN